MQSAIKTCLAASMLSVFAVGSAAATTVLRPDEAASKDTFVYAFAIPDTLGIPGAPNMLNFDTVNIPSTAAVPFGDTLGAAETIPFRNDPNDPNEPLRVHTTRSLVQFDLSSIAFGPGRLQNATFDLTGIGNLFPFDPPSAQFPVQIDLKPVLEAWDEQIVTWNTRPNVGSIVASYMMTDGFETLSFDVTSLVSGWLANPAQNFGFEISQNAIVETPPSSPGGRNRFAVGLFASSAAADESTRPALSVSEVPVPAALPMMLGAIAAITGIKLRSRKA